LLLGVMTSVAHQIERYCVPILGQDFVHIFGHACLSSITHVLHYTYSADLSKMLINAVHQTRYFILKYRSEYILSYTFAFLYKQLRI
jgi:hypothetical protein